MLKIRLYMRRYIFIYGVGWDIEMKIIVDVFLDIKIGFCNNLLEIYVVLIDNELLLGFDFLYRMNVVIEGSIN